MKSKSSEIQLTFLGTGTSQGVPVIGCGCKVCSSDSPKDKRLRVSVWIEVDGRSIVVDSGPDFRQQMLSAGVKQLDAILFTHEHKDHISGMDDIRAFNYQSKQPMDIYASKRVQRALEREYHYVFEPDPYPGVPRVKMHTIDSSPFYVNGIQVIPVEVMHYMLPVLGFRIGDLAYVTDAKTISDSEKEKLRSCKVLILNALRKEQHLSHLNLKEALELMEELAPEKGYLTHVSHLMGTHEEVSRLLPSHVSFAYDGLQVKV